MVVKMCELEVEKARITYLSIWTRQRKDRGAIQDNLSGRFQQRILRELDHPKLGIQLRSMRYRGPMFTRGAAAKPSVLGKARKGQLFDAEIQKEPR